ncbi:MAG: GNAT family N-acetyltransferase [Cyclobacteriaceae bacterium]|nr:GNAT family N-acetyltransferase [Cyclobacteriaceae bacterium]
MFYEFLINQFPFGYAYNFENFLYNKVRHIATQGLEERVDYFLVNKVKKRIEAKIHFLIDENHAYSPYKSLFGSFEFNHRFPRAIMQEFTEFILNDLKTRNITYIKITHHASCYSERKAMVVHDILVQLGFKLKMRAVNHHIPVDIEPLETWMSANEKRRLKKCLKDGFTFNVEPESRAEEIHDFIAQKRKEKNLDISISIEKLRLYLEEFPQTYSFFSIRKDEEICAATVAVRISKKILYNFLPASDTAYNAYSPMVMLLSEMYNYCQREKFEMFDLGISTTSDGKPQKSLIRFKTNIGALEGFKDFFEWEA